MAFCPELTKTFGVLAGLSCPRLRIVAALALREKASSTKCAADEVPYEANHVEAKAYGGVKNRPKGAGKGDGEKAKYERKGGAHAFAAKAIGSNRVRRRLKSMATSAVPWERPLTWRKRV